jgi:uncharacterized membrane protein
MGVSGLDTPKRSIAKSVSWRILAGFITAGVALFMTGQLAFAAKIGLVDTTVKLLIYFLHERLWNKIDYGRVKSPDYEV